MSALQKSGRVSLTIRKKINSLPSSVKTKNPKYYDPINRVGETIMGRIGALDRRGNLYEGDTLVVNSSDDPSGHINMTYHVVKLAKEPGSLVDLKKLSYFGSLQMEHPKMNEMIINNPSQNKEVIGVMKTAFALTDVHVLDIDKSFSCGQIVYAIPETAPKEYTNAEKNALRFVIGSKDTFIKALTDATPDGFGISKTDAQKLLPQFAAGRAHNGKKAGHGNCYYTIRY